MLHNICNKFAQLYLKLSALFDPGQLLSSELGAAFTLYRGSPRCSAASFGSLSTAFSCRERKGNPPCFANDLVWLRAEWTEEALDKIDGDAWVHLKEHASCSKEILAGEFPVTCSG